MKDEWYSPGQIQYISDDIIWMIAVVLPLGAGCWPPTPGSKIDNPEAQKTPSHTAPFERPAVVRAEVEKRLRMTKGDGVTLVWEIQKGSVEHYKLLCPAAKNALNYICSGPRRRRTKEGRIITYAEWKRDRKKNHKNVKIS